MTQTNKPKPHPPYDPALYPPPNATRKAELELARKERLAREAADRKDDAND